MTRFACSLAVTGSLVLLAGTLVEASPSDKARAKLLFREGRQLFHKKRYKKSIVQLEKAHRLWKHRTIVFNLALAHAHLGDNIRAVIHLRRFLAEAPPAERKLPLILQQVQQKVGVLVIQLPNPRAAIYVDGKLAGRGRVELVVEPGRRAIEIREGTRTVLRKSIEVPAGKEKTWELAELPRRRPARGRPLVIHPRLRLRPRPAVPPPVVPPPTRSRRGLHTGYFTTFTVMTAVSLAAAIAMGFKTKQAHEDFVASGRTDTALHDDGVLYQNIANALWGVTAAAAVTAAVVAIFTRWRRTERSKPSASQGAAQTTGHLAPQVSAKPTIWPGGAGLTVDW
ncbi:MAG: tetratricopeptide repeat protein [bacterium]